MQYKIVINPEYESIRELLTAIPSVFGDDAQAKTLHEQRNVVKYFKEHDIVVKRFVKISAFNRIMYSFFRKSKAERSFNNALRLEKLSIGTPTPIAYMEIKRGCILRDSYYVCANCTWDSLKDVFYGKISQENELLANSCIKFIADVHKKGVLHFDLNPANIFYKKDETGEYDFKLIDLNRMSFKNGYSLNSALNNLTRMTEDPDIFLYIVCRYIKIMNLEPYGSIKKCMENRIKRENHYKFKRLLKRLKCCK